LEIMLISTLDGARFESNVPRAWKSFWAHPMVLLGAVCQVEARFYPFGDNVNHGTRKVYGLCQMYHGHENLSRHA
jgi:hypothetical protein